MRLIILAKRLTEQQKKEIVKLFRSGISVEQISHRFNCTKLTISRNLKNNLGEVAYGEFLEVNNFSDALLAIRRISSNEMQQTSYSKAANKSLQLGNISKAVEISDKMTDHLERNNLYYKISNISLRNP